MAIGCVLCAGMLVLPPARAHSGDQQVQVKVGPLSVGAFPGLEVDLGAPRGNVPISGETFDEQLARVGRAIPAFGGFYTNDDTDTLYVYLTQNAPGTEGVVTSTLRSLFGLTHAPLSGSGPKAGTYARTVVLQARYPFSQLKQWHDSMARGVLALPDVVMTDIDDTRNRLLVGVSSASGRPAVERAMAALGIPRDAFVVEERPAIAPGSSVQDRHRPLVGGLQIATDGGVCTMGPIANRNGVMGFVTNSHCTRVTGGVESTRFYQPWKRGVFFLGRPGTDINDVGTETVDPPWSPTLATSASLCPSGRACRFSDSAFVRFSTSPSPPVQGRLGYFAVPPDLAYGSTQYAADFQINEVTNAWSGLTVFKEGRTTGLTWGPVTNTCANVNMGGTNKTLFCQFAGNYLTRSGDSGGLILSASNPGVAKLSGLNWTGSGQSSFFSPITSVTHPYELGRMYFCPSYRC